MVGSLRVVSRYIHLNSVRIKEAIIDAVEKEFGKSIDLIKIERGTLRQIIMDLLYRLGGLKAGRLLIFLRLITAQ